MNSGRYPERWLGVRLPGLKYLREESSGREELYDLARDPVERRDLAGESPDALRAPRRKLQEMLDALGPRAPIAGRKPVEGDVEHLEELRSLGCVE